MARLLLIDAYAMIYRAYYAFIRVPRMNSRGENTSAIFGFVTTLEDLLKKVQPTHLAVAFDPHGPTFRHEAFAAYKAQREETPEDIRKAVPVIKDILRAMNIPALEVQGFEADDVIGTMSYLAEKEGFEVKMATPDKDYGQLVTDHIHQYRPRHTGGFEEMGPKEVCEKYGLQNTAQVIDLLGLMGDASDNIPGCKGVGEKTAVQLLTQFGSIENMLAHTDELKGALRDKVESQVENIRFSRFLATIRLDVPIAFDADALVIRERNWTALREIYEHLEFQSLMKNTPMASVAQPAPKPKAKKIQSELTLDLFGEPSESPMKADKNAGEPDLFSSLSEETSAPQYDTIENRLITYLLNPEVAFNPNREPDLASLRQNEALYRLYQEMELPLVPVLRKMEQAGVRFDVNILHEAEKQLNDELSSLEQEIYALVEDNTWNINSPKQVGDMLFDRLKLDAKAKRGKNGAYSTAEDVLQTLRDKHPVVGKILDYRELKKLISTYISTLPNYIAEDGKIHATYNQTVTATGRLSCSNPNLQNLPVRSERGQLIRRAVIPDDGCVILSADYSQIELRLMAHFSQDEHMLQAFREGQDIHAATAAKIFHLPIEEVTREQRRRAKTANFGIIYGISAFGLAQQLECPRAEAKALIDGYFEAFPKVVEFIEAQKQFARENGYVETLFGRRRYLQDINSHNSVVRSFAERNAVNAPIQGTAADIIKMAMVEIDRQLSSFRSQLIMQVHDELNFNVPVDEIEQVRKIVVESMQNVVSLSVPLIADCGVGQNWLEAH